MIFHVTLSLYLAADSLRVEFDRRCSTEKNRDTLTIYNPTRSTIYIMSGREWNDWSIPLFLQGNFFGGRGRIQEF